MLNLDFKRFAKELEKAPCYSLENDVRKLGDKDISMELIDKFDRIMNAEFTAELSDLTEDDLFEIARKAKELSSLYKTQRFLSQTTFERIQAIKGKKRRVL